MSFAQTTSQFGSPEGSAGLLRGGPLVAGVEVSVLLSEAHSLGASAVNTALENGAVVTDHVILSPAEISIGFAMTNAGSGADQARDVFASFKRLRDERAVLELITEHTVYENMVVTGVNLTHQAPFKGALEVTVNLRQLHFVDFQGVGRTRSLLPKDRSVAGMEKRIEGGLVKARDITGELLRAVEKAVALGSGALAVGRGALAVGRGAVSSGTGAASSIRSMRAQATALVRALRG